MELKQNLSRLKDIAELARERALADLREIGEKRAALEAEIQALRQPAKSEPDPGMSLADWSNASLAWGRWRDAKLMVLNRELALLRMRQEELKAKAAQAFGRDQAISGLIDKQG